MVTADFVLAYLQLAETPEWPRRPNLPTLRPSEIEPDTIRRVAAKRLAAAWEQQNGLHHGFGIYLRRPINECTTIYWRNSFTGERGNLMRVETDKSAIALEIIIDQLRLLRDAAAKKVA